MAKLLEMERARLAVAGDHMRHSRRGGSERLQRSARGGGGQLAGSDAGAAAAEHRLLEKMARVHDFKSSEAGDIYLALMYVVLADERFRPLAPSPAASTGVAVAGGGAAGGGNTSPGAKEPC